MAEWKDTTSYSRGQERIPTSWTLKRGNVAVVVVQRHRMNPGFWTMHCSALGMDTVDTKLPDGVPAETAQNCAKTMAANRAREIAKLLSQ